MQSPQTTVSSALKVRKIIGRTYLNDNRLEEALDVFSGILRDYPQDVESLVILGNLYLASGDGKSAQILYQQAIQADPTCATSLQESLAHAEAESYFPASEPIPSDPQAVARLLFRLTGRETDVHPDDMWRAARMLDDIIHSEDPAACVAERLDEITAVLPALIEINIHQARRDGRDDIEAGLLNLKRNIQLQLQTQVFQPAEAPAAPVEEPQEPQYRVAWNVLFLNAGGGERSRRAELIRQTLQGLGCRLMDENTLPVAGYEERPDVVLVCNPHVQPRLNERLATLSALGIPIIVDLDTDFEQLPIFHPDYNTRGLSSPARSRAYTAALMLASLVTVGSEEQAAALRAAGYAAAVVPDGWSADNPLWNKERPMRSTLNIGWVNTPGQMEDLATVRRAVLRVLREFHHTQLVVVGDMQAYRLFENIPDNRKIFLPSSGPEEYPYLLSQVDIQIVPLRRFPFHETLSDAVLVEAGVKSIPWIASPAPSFARWRSGGMLAGPLEEWHSALRQMVVDRDMRAALGREGRQGARSRELKALGQVWLKTIHQVINHHQAYEQTVVTAVAAEKSL
jgi:tetratricopeptide (TPR) repeat protein